MYNQGTAPGCPFDSEVSCGVTHDTSLRSIFDSVAKLYDEVRPGYPEPLIEDIISLSEIGPGGGILEIGCGSEERAQFASDEESRSHNDKLRSFAPFVRSG